MELVYTVALKATDRQIMWVRVPLRLRFISPISIIVVRLLYTQLAAGQNRHRVRQHRKVTPGPGCVKIDAFATVAGWDLRRSCKAEISRFESDLWLQAGCGSPRLRSVGDNALDYGSSIRELESLQRYLTAIIECDRIDFLS